MTSSNDNKDSALPHAASHLVLYTNVKREKKQQTKKGKSRGRKEGERNRKEVEFEGTGGASGGSGSELANPSELL